MLLDGDERGQRARSSLPRDTGAAPEHWKIELLSTVRGLAIMR